MARKNARRALALSTALMLAAAGCELAVDFDRTKIDSGSIDAALADVGPVDATLLPYDAGSDAAGDATGADADAASASDGADADAAANADASDADASDGAPADADDAG